MSNGTFSQDVRRFFDFSLSPGPIHIILPDQPRQRKRTGARLKHYPPYNFEVAPDDVESAMKVYSLLGRAYGAERIKLGFTRVFPDNVEEVNRILIGGPPTNSFSCDALDEAKIYFVDGKGKRITRPFPKADSLQGRRIKVEKRGTLIRRIGTGPIDGKTHLTKDYCLISKRVTTGNKLATEFVIAGLRAYGQLGSCTFLGQEKFYSKARKLHEEIDDHFDFQVLVEVKPRNEPGRIKTKYKVVNTAVQRAPCVFLAYVHEDEHKVSRLARDLRKHKIRAKWDLLIRPTRRWKNWILENINDCDYCIVCFSESFLSKGRSYAFKELREIRNEAEMRGPGKLFFIPVLLSDCMSSRLRKAVPELVDFQDTKLYGRKRQHALDSLAKAIHEDFSGEAGWDFNGA